MYSFLSRPLIRAKSDDPKWSQKVTDKIEKEDKNDLPPELFTKNPGTIAQGLRQHSDDFEQAMQRLQFYINRAGKNLDTAAKSRLESAKDQLYKLYNKQPPKKKP